MHLFEKVIVCARQFSSFLFNMLLLLIFFFSFTEGTVLFFERASAVIRSHTHEDPNPFLEKMIVVFIIDFGLIALCTVWISKNLAELHQAHLL